MALSSVYTTAEQNVASSITATIQVKGLRKRYGAVEAVQGIDFTVSRGEVFGLIGPDGAGKSTVFQMLAGVMPIGEGKIEILGEVPQKARSQLGYLTQTFSLYADLSILENLRYIAGLRHVSSADFDSRARELLALMGLERFQNRLARQLSGGMKQKLALCCALISKPQILLLDEPTTGVDPISRREFWDLLAKIAADGVTIVAATPYLDEAERCHRIALIYAGKIQQIGTLSQLQNQLKLQRIEVYTPSLFAAEAALQETARGHSEVLKDIQSFGDRLDVLTPRAEAAKDLITQSLSQKQLPIQSLDLRPPTLENVFVNHIRQQGAALTYQPFPHYRPSRHIAKETKVDGTFYQPQTAISAHRLQKVFGTFHAVKDVSLTIQYGEIYGLLGANGAGKTTVIKMLCGLLPVTSGEMTLAGERHNLHRPELRSRLGYMSQKFTLYNDLTIRQNLEFYCGVYGIPRQLQEKKINWVLTTCGLVGQESTLTKRLPGGWKQQVAFGASVMHEPDILFLDEPTSGVDPLARRQFWKLIRDFAHKGTAILVTTHYLEEAENCNRLAFMIAGEIVIQGTPSEIKQKQSGQLFELETNQTQKAAYLLKQQLTPWRVSIFGNQLHLVLEHPEQELSLIRSTLQSAQIEILGQRPIPFTLEDAFIGTARRVREGE